MFDVIMVSSRPLQHMNIVVCVSVGFIQSQSTNQKLTDVLLLSDVHKLSSIYPSM